MTSQVHPASSKAFRTIMNVLSGLWETPGRSAAVEVTEPQKSSDGPRPGGENRTRGQRVGPAPAGSTPTGQFLALGKDLSFTEVARCSPEVTPCHLQRSGAGNPLVLPPSHTDAPAHNKTPLRLQGPPGASGAPARAQPNPDLWVLPPAVYRGS